MGVVNVTPDSFSDGGRFLAADAALQQALTLVREGAAIVDIGGESTRPGSEMVPADEELRRVLPVIESLAGSVGVPISVDTMKAEVARRALSAGATIINDVSALRFDDEMASVVAETGCPVCLMHMKGQPKTMQDDPRYDDVVDEVLRFLEERMSFALARGVREEQIMVDPGLGFGKTVAHNLALLDGLDRFSHARPSRPAGRVAQALSRRHPRRRARRPRHRHRGDHRDRLPGRRARLPRPRRQAQLRSAAGRARRARGRHRALTGRGPEGKEAAP